MVKLFWSLLFLLSILITGPSFMSLSSPILGLWQFDINFLSEHKLIDIYLRIYKSYTIYLTLPVPIPDEEERLG